MGIPTPHLLFHATADLAYSCDFTVLCRVLYGLSVDSLWRLFEKCVGSHQRNYTLGTTAGMTLARAWPAMPSLDEGSTQGPSSGAQSTVID